MAVKVFSVASMGREASRTRQRSRHIGAGTLALILAVLSLMLSSLMPAAQQAAAQSSDWSPPSTVYIPETGHSLDRLFLDLWRNAGGASAFGYPISPEITTEDGHVVQYLQFARFEYWPEGDENGNTVILGKIGKELRPITVQRSLIASTQPGNSAVLLDSARQMKAWLPVDAASVDMGRNDLVYVEATQHTIWGGFLTFWQNSGAESYLGNPLTEEYTLNGTTYQVFERGQLTWKPGSAISLVPVGKMLAEKYGVSTEPIAQGTLPTYSENLFVPPPEPTPEPTVEIAKVNEEFADVPSGEVWIDISLSYEYMTVYQGNTVLMETYISSGKPGFETPAGTYFINSKIPEQDMEGVLGGEYYNVPSVPSVMYFTDVGHAIHGAYWHNNFGTPMSHGCINVPVDLAAYLYNIASVGTRVEIHW
ncbi:MAG TPA: L,D-transpeptidase [Thermomicrobiales bacterium]|nr:L,D-transpeptidase [Thermomicrobiales bacterium]